MLITFAFDHVAVVAADLYFQHPNPPPGQEGAEHGVRLELRHIEAGELRGSAYSARPLCITEPLWRVDLLRSVRATGMVLDRAHHHPTFTAWDESARVFVDELRDEPLAWLEKELSDLPAVLRRAGAMKGVGTPRDLAELRLALPRILASVRWLLDLTLAGELGPPAAARDGLVRSSWL
jgi:hypothetical protein